MQEKTIKSVLSRKLDHWLKHVDDPAIVDIIEQNAICTGGAIASMLLNEKVNDFDFYFKTSEAAYAVAKYYVEKFKQNPPSRFKNKDKVVDIAVRMEEDRVSIVVQSQGIAGESGSEGYEYFEQVSDPSEPHEFVAQVAQDKTDASTKTDKDAYRPVFLTSNAITLSDDIQIVTRFFGNVAEIHENYDFVHCTCSWDAATWELRTPHEALMSLLNKRLKYKRSKYPLCSIIRTRKFLSAGWTIDAGQYVKMAWDLNALDLKDIKVLRDQMVGVDSAYFHEVIHLLEKQQHDQNTKEIESTYLMEVIDKIFG